jgi:beta-fructofuranosidase
MQYWKPMAEAEFAGDMMPFWDGNRFHLFYLLDRNHHAEQGGLGGHQWAHASTGDLVEWEHHPLALPIGEPGSVDENGICTGSIFEHEGVYHAFYATRLKRPDGSVYEAVCRAASGDLIHFDKSSHNPMFAAPLGLDPRNHRDPFVFRHSQTGEFHMLVTASREPDTPDEGGERGVLAHYTSDNGEQWQYRGPFLALDKDPSPECPELFCWNGWWYLVYSQGAQMQYQVSRDALGPWRRARRDTIEGPNLSVPRTASWTGGRRLAVGFLPWRRDGRDDGGYVYAGSAVFRELLQDADGTLATRFIPEMMPPTGPPLPWRLEQASPGTVCEPGGAIFLDARQETATAQIPEVPADALLACRIVPSAGTAEYGLLLRTDDQMTAGYRLRFLPQEGRATLQQWPERSGETRAVATGIEGLDRAVDVVVCLKDSIIDVCLNERHTLIERCFDHRGSHLGLFAQAGEARVENLRLAPLL